MVRYRYSREPVPLIPGPAYPKGNSLFGYRYLAYKQDQGSVLAVRVFGSLSIYFTPQLEVDLVNDLLKSYPIYSLTNDLSSGKNTY